VKNRAIINTSIIILIMTAAAWCHGQTAKVIQLSPEDAKQAKSLDDEQKALTAKTEAFMASIRKTYLQIKKTDDLFVTGCTSSLKREDIKCYKNGWNFGDFEYSEDFKSIVPVNRPNGPMYPDGTILIGVQAGTYVK
jgi:hypothetical protein